MKTNARLLIKELIAITHTNIKVAEDFRALSTDHLNQKPYRTAWSILECLEHLNRYDAFYLPEIDKYLNNTNYTSGLMFKSGIFGSYLVKMTVPKKDGKKIKTFPSMDPAGSTLTVDVLDTFLTGQHILLSILEKSQERNLSKNAIPVTFTKFIKLRLGDALRFMVYHNQRHVMQAFKNVKVNPA